MDVCHFKYVINQHYLEVGVYVGVVNQRVCGQPELYVLWCIATSVRDKGRNSFNNPDDVSALQQQLQALRDKASRGCVWFQLS